MTELTPVTEASAVKAQPTLPDAQEVTHVQHWTDRLFSFRVTRPQSLRFRSGEFVMIGLMGDPDPKTGKQKPLLRAYSIASPAWGSSVTVTSVRSMQKRRVAPTTNAAPPGHGWRRCCSSRAGPAGGRGGCGSCLEGRELCRHRDRQVGRLGAPGLQEARPLGLDRACERRRQPASRRV